MNTLPIVSIAVRAYNQEKQVVKALDSILDQNVDFPLQIVVGIDKSTDDTLNIVQSYINKLPQHISLEIVTYQQNVGSVKNLYNVFLKCNGKYIAWLDGDDYWIDKNKTQKAVDILEEDSSVGVVYTNDYVDSVHESSLKERIRLVLSDNDAFSDLLTNNYITSETVVFRTSLLKYVDFNNLIANNYPADDWYIWLELSNHTKFKHISDHTAAACVTRHIDENTPLASLEYEKKNLALLKYYVNKYSNNTKLKEKDLENSFFLDQFKSSILIHKKELAFDAIRNISFYRNKKQQLLCFFLYYFPFGFNIYIFYRKLKGKDKKTLMEIYWN